MSLNTKIAEMQRLSRMLDVSLELEGVWPDLFQHGKCKAGPVKLPGKAFVTAFRITSGSGEVRYIPVSELDKNGTLYSQCRERTPNTLMFDRANRKENYNDTIK